MNLALYKDLVLTRLAVLGVMVYLDFVYSEREVT